MIDRLKDLIDEAEDRPKAKKILLLIAEMKEENQERALQLVELMIKEKE